MISGLKFSSDCILNVPHAAAVSNSAGDDDGGSVGAIFGLISLYIVSKEH